MIFFVLVIDLSQQDLEDLILPKATFMQPDDDAPDVRPVANILQNGDLYYKGTRYYHAEKDQENYKGIERLLKEWRRDLKLTMKPLQEKKAVSKVNPLVPDDPVSSEQTSGPSGTTSASS